MTDTVITAPSRYFRPTLFNGTNNPTIEGLCNSLFGEFSDAADGLSLGVQQVTRYGERVIAILYLIHRAASVAPGINQNYMEALMKTKGSLTGAKLFNYALAKIPAEQRDAIDMMFGNVKTQMCQALQFMFEHYAPMVTPTIDEVVDFIHTKNGIKGLGMAYMTSKQAEQNAAAEAAEREQEILQQARRQEREDVARANGFDTFDEYARAENQKAELARFEEVRKFLAARGTMAEIDDGLKEGRFYLYVAGELRLLSEEDERKIMNCAASLI